MPRIPRDAQEEYAGNLLTALRTGEQIGSSAMASGFQHAAGLGDLSLRVNRDAAGTLRLTGHLGWASNLFDDAVIFAPAYGPSETADPVVIAFPVGADGVEVGPELDLLALRGTVSTSVTVTDVALRQEQILTTDLASFLGRARPVLSVLQASFCIGLATESYRHLRTQLTGVKYTFTAELAQLADRLVRVKQQLVELASAIDIGNPPAVQRLIAARLEAGVLANELTRLETITAGSRGFVTTSDVNRRYREATSFPYRPPPKPNCELSWRPCNSLTKHDRTETMAPTSVSAPPKALSLSLMFVAVLALALNLRAAASSVGPLLAEIGHGMDIGGQRWGC